MNQSLNRIMIITLLAVFFTTSSLVPAAKTAVIDTSIYLDRDQNITSTELIQILEREDVQKQLIALGVDPVDAHNRITKLSQDELRVLQQKMDELPAGSDVLAILGAVLIIFIVLELFGVTNIFTKI